MVDRLRGVNGNAAFKIPCRCATTAAITLNGLQTIDGVAVAQDDRVLVKDQADEDENGIYSADTGEWTRTLDCDGPDDVVAGTLVLVRLGTENGDRIFTLEAL